MSDNPDPRHVARAIALQTLFQKLVTTDLQAEAYPDTDLLLELEVDSYDEELAEQIIAGTEQHQEKIDLIIVELAPAWPIDSIAPADLIVLRMAIWEAFIGKINPAKVVINEAIELAKEFGGETSGPFVNGVLGNLVKNDKLKGQLATYGQQ